MIMLPVAGCLVQFHIGHDWCVDVLVTQAHFFVDDVTFKRTTDRRTFRQPEWQAGTDFRSDHE